MENSPTVKAAIEKKLPCPFCGNKDYKKCETKIVRIDGKQFEMRIICKNEIPGRGHCGTDLTFETEDRIEMPLYGKIIPIPDPRDQKLGILLIRQE